MNGLMGWQMGKPEDNSSHYICHGDCPAGWRKESPLDLPQDDGVEPLPAGVGRGVRLEPAFNGCLNYSLPGI